MEGLYCVMDNGETYTEETHKWSKIPIEKVKEIHLVVKGKDFCIKRSACPNFVEWIHFKTAQVSFSGSDKLIEQTIGWHNGTTAFLLKINQKNAEFKEEVGPLKVTHLHPSSKIMIKG